MSAKSSPPAEFDNFSIWFHQDSFVTYTDVGDAVDTAVKDMSIDNISILYIFIGETISTSSSDELMRIWNNSKSDLLLTPKGARDFWEKLAVELSRHANLGSS